MGQGGNVYELEETDFDLVNGPSTDSRGYRGGSWTIVGDFGLLSSRRGFANPSTEDDIVGFRVASIPVPNSSLGDYNHDGIVGAADYVLWRKYLGNIVPPGTNGDANGNGFVENADYQPWRANYGRIIGTGTGASVSATIPEPSTSLLLIFATKNTNHSRNDPIEPCFPPGSSSRSLKLVYHSLHVRAWQLVMTIVAAPATSSTLRILCRWCWRSTQCTRRKP